MQDQRNKFKDLSELDLLKQRIIDLEAENAKIEVKNKRLKQIIEENSKHDAEFKAELRSASKNAELKTEVAKLRHNLEKIKLKGIIIDSSEQLLIFLPAKNETISIFTKIENSNNTHKESNTFNSDIYQDSIILIFSTEIISLEENVKKLLKIGIVFEKKKAC
ncbi:4347_t:CDS:2, partial [Cetraspora pellucida]